MHSSGLCGTGQIHRPYAKPLIVFTPKWLLHHGHCVSSLADFETGSAFRRLIDDGTKADNLRHLHPRRKKKKGTHLDVNNSSGSTDRFELAPREEARRLILCSGQVYYKLAHLRRQRSGTDDGEARLAKARVALCRLEQVAPFPFERVVALVERYPNAEVVWVQEEPQNMGCWSYVKPRFDTAIRELLLQVDPSSPVKEMRYIGRPASAVTATGCYFVHKEEESDFLREAMDLTPAPADDAAQ
jgi:2-oxoglutarate dehydrogenase E1 component